MGKFKRGLPVISIASIFIITFNIISFILVDEHNMHFWCGYSFITLSWVCSIVTAILPFTDEQNEKSMYLNAPSIIVSVTHLVIQMIVGIMAMVFSFVSIKIILCLEILILAIYLNVIGALEVYKNKNR